MRAYAQSAPSPCHSEGLLSRLQLVSPISRSTSYEELPVGLGAQRHEGKVPRVVLGVHTTEDQLAGLLIAWEDCDDFMLRPYTCANIA